jgi:hypothetical protein
VSGYLKPEEMLMSRRNLLLLQLTFALVAIVALGLTVWALLSFVHDHSFTLTSRDLMSFLGQDMRPVLQSLLASATGDITAVAVAEDNAPWSIYLPLIATVVSILGFLSTTVLAWRKERRESSREALELERLRLEIEDLKHKVAQQQPTT